jgi:alkylation response protein AidB-like acyl-CoA dehydrogenase
VRLLLLSRALGAARRSFELALEHAKTRHQFGQPIGRFQALQHKLANAVIDLDGAGLTIDYAAQAYDRDDEAWRAFALAAVAFGSPALRRLANESHHTLGAVGYAEEHEATTHFRRVHIDTLLLGGPNEARTQLASWAGAHAGSLPDYDFGAEASAFRTQVRAWFESNWVGPLKTAHDRRPLKERGYDKALSRALGGDNWIGLSWPTSEGGQARSVVERLMFQEEAAKYDAPLSAHSAAATLVGPALLAFAGETLKADVAPRILRGEVTVCLGYSEPEAGSDLAALRTSAKRSGGDWVINGQKLWTTYGEKADYVFLAARTNTEVKKHEGITIFLVPMNTPGIEVRPSMALYGRTFCTVFYDNVKASDAQRVGAVDGGWTVLTSALADERILMGAGIMQSRMLLARLVRELRDGGEATQTALGALLAEVEVARQLLMRSVTADPPAAHHAAMTKVFSSELMQRLGEIASELLGSAALLSEDAPGAVLDGAFEQWLRYSIMHVIGGGTNEIQRNLIAQRGLGLPR